MTYADTMRRYQELFREYESLPRGDGAAHTALNSELIRVENNLLRTPPLDKAKGLIHGGPKLQCPTVTERLDQLIPESDWIDKINDTDSPRMRPFVWKILDQDGIGSCASEGLSGAIMCTREKQGLPQIELNPWMVYGRVNGGSDSGSSLSANMQFMQTYGVAAESVWPRSKGWRTKPSDASYENALRHRVLEYASVTNKQEFGTCLLLGIPVYFGYSGHAIFGTDPYDTVRFGFANSWHKNWGDQGFGTLSYSSIMWSYGAYAILSVTAPDDEV